MLTVKEYYRQRLPHFQTHGECFFVTFRLHGSIHNSVVRELQRNYHGAVESTLKNYMDEVKQGYRLFKLRKRLMLKYDEILDNREAGPRFLSNTAVAEICKEQLHRFDGELYQLIAYVIMNNHVHILIDTSAQNKGISHLNEPDNPIMLDQIMKRIKGASAFYANKNMNRNGQFWARESYDVRIRNYKMLQNVISYILENPVKAGLVNNWYEFQHVYLSPEYGTTPILEG